MFQQSDTPVRLTTEFCAPSSHELNETDLRSMERRLADEVFAVLKSAKENQHVVFHLIELKEVEPTPGLKRHRLTTFYFFADHVDMSPYTIIEKKRNFWQRLGYLFTG